VLKGLDLSLDRGEVVALIGPSGSGKSTFIRCLNMMEVPTGGTIRFRQKPVGKQFRDKGEEIGIGTLRRHVGMVFQHFNLFPHKTVLQNVTEGPIVVCNRPKREAEELAMDPACAGGGSRRNTAPIQITSRVVRSSASPLRERLRCSRKSCSSTK
jgi:polar amino acid transport system ATP-binding protein